MKTWLNGLMIILTLTSSNCLGKTISLTKDEKAPFAGVLFDNEDANKAKNSLIEIDLLNKLNGLYLKNTDIDNQKITILMQQNDVLSKNLQSAQEMHTWEKIAYIGLGVLAVSLGGLLVSRIQK